MATVNDYNDGFITQPIQGTKWRRLNISRAVRETPPPLEFTVGNLPAEPGLYGLIIGPDGSRKSWLALHVALACATGRETAGGLWPPRPGGRVVYVTSEDSEDEMRRRLHTMARALPTSWGIGDLDDRLDILPLAQSDAGMTLIAGGVAGVEEQPDLAALIRMASGARLIILDPVADLADADDSDDRAGRAMVQALRRISRETGAGVLVVGHQNKASMLARETHQQSMRGSSRVAAGARWVVTLQPMGADAAKYGIDEADARRWTMVHEPKSSYAAADGMRALYHYHECGTPEGLMPGIPLFRSLPVTVGSGRGAEGGKGKVMSLKAGRNNDAV